MIVESEANLAEVLLTICVAYLTANIEPSDYVYLLQWHLILSPAKKLEEPTGYLLALYTEDSVEVLFARDLIKEDQEWVVLSIAWNLAHLVEHSEDVQEVGHAEVELVGVQLLALIGVDHLELLAFHAVAGLIHDKGQVVGILSHAAYILLDIPIDPILNFLHEHSNECVVFFSIIRWFDLVGALDNMILLIWLQFLDLLDVFLSALANQFVFGFLTTSKDTSFGPLTGKVDVLREGCLLDNFILVLVFVFVWDVGLGSLFDLKTRRRVAACGVSEMGKLLLEQLEVQMASRNVLEEILDQA